MLLASIITPAIGATSVLAVMVILILTGRIVPRSALRDLRKDKDKVIDLWQSAHDKQVQINLLQQQQIIAMMEMARTTTHVLESLPTAPDRTENAPNSQT